MGLLRLCWRGLFAGVFTSIVVARMRLLNLFFGKNYPRNLRIRRRWARVVLKNCGIRLTVSGDIPASPCVLVVNHRSWLDPMLILRDVLAFPVAKAEMSDWPLLGSGAKLAGIIYVQREDSGSRLSTLRQMAIQIKAGHSIMIFPEGTTSDLEGTLPFKTGAFQVAAKMKIPVVPVALLYADKA
ncbi:MAG: 1-acyl-sn-glycerol-3-phosphate acyltransferase, partial [Saprospiraceae bacterium]|nr:1-acyl-sn-glycerol-3-phosphate acyltransferase [Saprospiraceae bacterium]